MGQKQKLSNCNHNLLNTEEMANSARSDALVARNSRGLKRFEATPPRGDVWGAPPLLVDDNAGDTRLAGDSGALLHTVRRASSAIACGRGRTASGRL